MGERFQIAMFHVGLAAFAYAMLWLAWKVS